MKYKTTLKNYLPGIQGDANPTELWFSDALSPLLFLSCIMSTNLQRSVTTSKNVFMFHYLEVFVRATVNLNLNQITAEQIIIAPITKSQLLSFS